MWVRFWHTEDCEGYSRYEYESDRETDISLKEIAHEYIADWAKDGWGHIDHGFEILSSLPKPIRQKLLAQQYRIIEHASEMVRILSRPDEV